jgi:hypothetical protein
MSGYQKSKSAREKRKKGGTERKRRMEHALE